MDPYKFDSIDCNNCPKHFFLTPLSFAKNVEVEARTLYFISSHLELQVHVFLHYVTRFYVHTIENTLTLMY